MELSEFNGLKVSVSGRMVYIPFETCWQLFGDFYENTEHACLPLIYERGDRVLDTGAGIGFITGEIASLADYVVGVEAIPYYANVAKLNTDQAGNVTILQGAIGLSDAPVTFNQRYLAYASSLLDNEHGAHDPIEQSFEAPGISINDLIAGYSLNALHLDLEGTEVDLLDGTDLSHINKVTLETHQYIYGKEGTARIMAALFRGGLIPYLANRPNVSLDDRDTFVISWARPAIVTRLQEQFKTFVHRTIRFSDLELRMIPRSL